MTTLDVSEHADLIRAAFEGGAAAYHHTIEGEPCNPNAEFAGDCRGPEGCTGRVVPERFRVVATGEPIQLVARCQTCNSKERYLLDRDALEAAGVEVTCEFCDGGSVLVAWARITVLPVQGECWVNTIDPSVTVMSYEPGTLMVIENGMGHDIPTPDPPPVVGGFVVRFEFT